MMSKDFLEGIAPFAALAALPVLGPGAAGAAGSGILGTTPYAAPAMGAFGSADMLLAGAAGMPAQGALLAAPAAEAAAAPGTIETAGLDFINGVPQNMGARFESLLGDFTDSFKPDSLLKMGTPQQQPQTRPVALTSQVKPVGRNAPQQEPTQPLYDQPINGQENLTPEQMWQRELLRRKLLMQGGN